MFFRTTLVLATLLSAFCVFTECEPETGISRDYPLVKTLSVDAVTEEGAIFNARIINSPEAIDEYGFVWGNSVILNVRESERIFNLGVPADLDFSFAITGSFENFHTYFVSAYVRSGELIIYGNSMEFSIE